MKYIEGESKFTVETQDKSVKYNKLEFIFDNFVLEQGEKSDDGLSWHSDDIQLLVDGKDYVYGTEKLWNGTSLDAGDLFENMMQAYLRDEKKYSYTFSDNFKDVLDTINTYYKKYDENKLLIEMPAFGSFLDCPYKLDMATDEHRYYVNDAPRFLVLSADGNIITDMEDFYTECYLEDIALHSDKIIYKGEYYEDTIKNYKEEIEDIRKEHEGAER